MSNKHPPQQTVSSSEAGAPEATILRGASKATTPPLRGTPPYQEGSHKNSPPEKGEYPEGGRGLIPKLRFPEFRDEGEWRECKLSDVVIRISNGLSLDQANNTSGFKVTRIETISGNAIDLEKIGHVLTDQDISRYRLNVGDVLFSNINSLIHIGRSVLVDKDYDLYHGMNLLRLEVSHSSNDARFIFYLINTENVRSGFKARANKAVNQASINQTEVGNTFVIVPKIEEQQKIADCLSSLDTLIAAQTEKIDALKIHKKGLMQQLFPQDGETVPRLRFPEFWDAGEWEEKTLGQVAAYENGKAHEQDIVEQGKYIVANSKFISTCGEVKKFSNTANLLAKKDDILMVLSDVPNGRAIAKCFYVDRDNAYTVNQRICRLTANEAVSAVLLYLLDRNAYFLGFDDGVKQTNLKKDDVLSCPVLLPEDKTEQQKIAHCLSALDTLIAAETEKLDTLKTHKKGLMQQLFPAVENEAGS